MSKPLRNRTALIVGASRGIGLAAAHALADAGADLVLAARSVAPMDAAATGLREKGATVVVARLDVADYAAVDGLIGGLDRLDIVLNNAAVITPIGPMAAVDPAAWKAAIDINLTGAFNVLHASLKKLKESDAPTVINTSSGAASGFLEGWSAYCATKAGLAMLTRALAEEAGPANLRAYGFRPGVVDTEMQVEIRASGINRVSQLPRETLLDPAIPGAAMAWLAKARPEEWHGQEVDVRDPAFQAAAGLRTD